MSISPTQLTEGDLRLFKFRFTPKTPNIASGAEVVLPDPLSVVYAAFVVVHTAWDGTTPHCDFGFSEAGDQTYFMTLGSGAVSVAAGGTSYGGAVESSAFVAKPLEVVPINYKPDGTPSGTQTPTALYVRVNQTGAVGGAASGSTVGDATLYLLLGNPIDLNLEADQPLQP